MFIPIGVGAAVGTLVGGRVVDRLIRGGKIDARITVSAVAFIAAAVLFLPGLYSAVLFVSVPLFSVAAACLTAPNPALDAARLDVVPSRLWGRGEAVRTFSELVLEAFAPLIFGYVSMQFGGPGANLGPGVNGRGATPVSPAQGRGLEYTFIIMLVPLLAAGLLLLVSRRQYLRDVATADVSDRALRDVAIKSVEAERADGSGAAPPVESKALGGARDGGKMGSGFPRRIAPSPFTPSRHARTPRTAARRAGYGGRSKLFMPLDRRKKRAGSPGKTPRLANFALALGWWDDLPRDAHASIFERSSLL